MCPTSGRFSWGMGIQYFSVDWRWRDHDQGQSNLLVADCGQQKYISLYNSTVQSSGDIQDIPKHNLVPQHVSSILVTSRLNKLLPGSEQQQVVDDVSEPWAVALCDHEWEYFLLTINTNDLWQSDIFFWHIYLSEFDYFVWREDYLYRTSFKRRKINLITKFPVPGLPPPQCRDLLLCPGKTALFQVSRKLKSLLIWEMREKTKMLLKQSMTEWVFPLLLLFIQTTKQRL